MQLGFGNSLQLAKTELGIVLEVNNGDALVGSWSAHLIGCIVPFLFIIIEFEDWGDCEKCFAHCPYSTLKK